MKNLSVLGSTGSIGTQTLDVVRSTGRYNVVALTTNGNIALLEEQIKEFKPSLAVVNERRKGKRAFRKTC